MLLEYSAATQAGKNKEKNEDRILIDNMIISNGNCYGQTEEPIIALICDGVGGEKGGDFASQIAAESFLGNNKKDMTGSSIVDCFLKANNNIREMQKSIPQYQNMATTIAGMTIYENEIVTFNAGDTRIYKLNVGNKIEQITIDHTVASKKMASHEISSIEDATIKDCSTLTKYLGGCGESAHINVKIRRADIEDLFLICSDGIYKSVSDAFIFNVLESNCSIEEKQKTIFSEARKNGLDDMSLIVLRTINQFS